MSDCRLISADSLRSNETIKHEIHVGGGQISTWIFFTPHVWHGGLALTTRWASTQGPA